MAALRAGPPPPVCRWGRRPHRGAMACRLLERDDRITQYCHCQYCMVYSIQKEGRGKGVPCIVVVQYYCNSVGLTDGRGNRMTIGSFTDGS